MNRHQSRFFLAQLRFKLAQQNRNKSRQKFVPAPPSSAKNQVIILSCLARKIRKINPLTDSGLSYRG